MSRHDDTVRMHHMLDHAHEAVQMASERNRPDLDSDRQFALAMTRLPRRLSTHSASPRRNAQSPKGKYAVRWV